ncbi:MAG: sortase [Clostridiales bacterium]|jgi:SrtB family sortase|nr:sortase [Clostridiales bacterium]
MKKFALGLLVTLCVAALAYVLLFMKEKPAAPSSSESVSQQSQPELNVYKKADTLADIQEALDYEISQNPDTVAWLQVPGTQISNSVLQAHDNFFYLRQNERRQADVYGCYFADYECSVGARDVLSHNTIVYGHSDLQDNPEGKRFSQLHHFTDPDFAQENRVITFVTPTDAMRFEIFAVFYTDVGFDYIEPEPNGGIAALAATAKEKSLYDYGVSVGDDDHILTLSTCTVQYGADNHNYRFVVMGRLLGQDDPEPEKTAITVKGAQ